MNFGVSEALEPLRQQADLANAQLSRVLAEQKRTNELLEQLVKQRDPNFLARPPVIDVTGDTTPEEINDAARQAVRAVRKGGKR